MVTFSINAQYSPNDFANVVVWAKWLDENDTNVGVIDGIYDFKFTQLSFNNKVVLKGKSIISIPNKSNEKIYFHIFQPYANL